MTTRRRRAEHPDDHDCVYCNEIRGGPPPVPVIPAKVVAQRAAATARKTAQRIENKKRLTAIKLERGCVDCGFNAHPDALHFDHREGVEKKFGLATCGSRLWSTILVELAKCEVRCANCHAIRTAQRRSLLTAC